MTRKKDTWPSLPKSRSWKRDRAEIVVQAGCVIALFFCLLIICLRPGTPGWAAYLMGCAVAGSMGLVARRISVLLRYRRQRKVMAGSLDGPVEVYLDFGEGGSSGGSPG